MHLTGMSLIGARSGAGTQESFRGFAPGTGTVLEPPFFVASSEEVNAAAAVSSKAFPIYASIPGSGRAHFLRAIAAKLQSAETELAERAHLETALPLPRLRSEIARTAGQLRLFASVVDEGSWSLPRIDHADSNRKPAAKPDIRSMLRPLGPVAVFGASNFPFAFSVAGGDTASALAAGNPVIVKAHPAHPGTSELVGRLIQESVVECGLPEGVFSLLFDSGPRVGEELVAHPLIKAGGFTGSFAAGRALFRIAANRPEPIPFYAEMGSTNPLFVLPRALASSGQKIAEDLYSSFTLGAGQFCTKPGLIFVGESAGLQDFFSALGAKVEESASFTLLTDRIRQSYDKTARDRERNTNVQVFTKAQIAPSGSACAAPAVVYRAEASVFMEDASLAEEMFGPSTLLIACKRKEEILECARRLHGHLTATIHGTAEDLQEYAELLPVLVTKVGRIIFNGYPTGVEVCHAMVHGGPFPSTADSRTTSVGTLAIHRFARPVCYQDCPDALLPGELQENNPLNVWRLVDGEFTNARSC
jgi:NADP-dependent aldehyde dehydrogenase